MSVKPIPDGYHTATPYLIVKGAAKALDFYKRAFGAEEMVKLETPDGSIAHAEFRVGDSPIMLGEEMAEMGFLAPQGPGASPVSIMLYVADADVMFAQAITAGATEASPVADQFYGDRSGILLDPFGHRWTIATHIEDVSAEEIHRRFAEMLSQKGEDNG